MAVYKDIYDGPPRGHTAVVEKKLYIAIHCTANTAPARNEASYAKRRTDNVSSHYYVDGKEIIQSLDTRYRAWHAGSSRGNSTAISYEITGLTSWSRQKWLSSVAWPLLARQILLDCRAHGIEPRRLTVEQIKSGKLTGIITHNDMRLAWGGTDHTDPGPNFPMDHLINLLGEGGDELSWTQELKIPEWFKEQFPGEFKGGDATAQFYLTRAYGYGRMAWQDTQKILGMQEAILAALAGKDVLGAVRSELERYSSDMMSKLDEIAALVAQREERDATEIVDEIARRLSPGT